MLLATSCDAILQQNPAVPQITGFPLAGCLVYSYQNLTSYFTLVEILMTYFIVFQKMIKQGSELPIYISWVAAQI